MRTKDAILSELAAEQAKLASLDHTREQARAKIEALRSELAVAIATPRWAVIWRAEGTRAPGRSSPKAMRCRISSAITW